MAGWFPLFTPSDPFTTLDGRLGAPAGSAQYPTLLNTYTAKPAWNVAGVHYAVGPPSGQSYTDPSVSPPSGTSFAGNTLTVNSDNTTIDGYDFTLFNSGQGVQIFCAKNNLTIQNCKFNGAGTHLIGGSIYVISFAGAGLTIKKCTMDGQSQNANGTIAQIGQSSLIVASGSSAGNITLQYNWFKNYCQHVLETNGNVTALDYRYNLIDDTLLPTGAHMNWLQWANSLTTTCDTGSVQFNTGRQITAGGSEGFQWGPAVTNTSVTIGYNTIVAPGVSAGTIMSYMLHVQDDTPAPGGGTVNNAQLVSNYADITGANGLIYPSTAGWTSSGNINMSTGGAL